MSEEAPGDEGNENVAMEKRTYMCPHCGLDYVIRRDLRAHLLAIHAAESYPCGDCGAMCHTLDEYAEHARVAHRGQSRHFCHLCSRSYKCGKQLVIHINHKHKIEGSIFCAKCGQEFHNSVAHKKHLQLHHKPHHIYRKCNKCDRSFKVNKQLILHKEFDHKKGGKEKVLDYLKKLKIKKSLMDDASRCKSCNVKFKYSIDLIEHLKVDHVKVKKFTCCQCSAVYLSRASLGIHLRHDHRIINHSCDKCPPAQTRSLTAPLKPKIAKKDKLKSRRRNRNLNGHGENSIVSLFDVYKNSLNIRLNEAIDTKAPWASRYIKENIPTDLELNHASKLELTNLSHNVKTVFNVLCTVAPSRLKASFNESVAPKCPSRKVLGKDVSFLSMIPNMKPESNQFQMEINSNTRKPLKSSDKPNIDPTKRAGCAINSINLNISEDNLTEMSADFRPLVSSEDPSEILEFNSQSSAPVSRKRKHERDKLTKKLNKTNETHKLIYSPSNEEKKILEGSKKKNQAEKNTIISSNDKSRSKPAHFVKTFNKKNKISTNPANANIFHQSAQATNQYTLCEERRSNVTKYKTTKNENMKTKQRTIGHVSSSTTMETPFGSNTDTLDLKHHFSEVKNSVESNKHLIVSNVEQINERYKNSSNEVTDIQEQSLKSSRLDDSKKKKILKKHSYTTKKREKAKFLEQDTNKNYVSSEKNKSKNENINNKPASSYEHKDKTRRKSNANICESSIKRKDITQIKDKCSDGNKMNDKFTSERLNKQGVKTPQKDKHANENMSVTEYSSQIVHKLEEISQRKEMIVDGNVIKDMHSSDTLHKKNVKIPTHEKLSNYSIVKDRSLLNKQNDKTTNPQSSNALNVKIAKTTRKEKRSSNSEGRDKRSSNKQHSTPTKEKHGSKNIVKENSSKILDAQTENTQRDEILLNKNALSDKQLSGTFNKQEDITPRNEIIHQEDQTIRMDKCDNENVAGDKHWSEALDNQEDKTSTNEVQGNENIVVLVTHSTDTMNSQDKTSIEEKQNSENVLKDKISSESINKDEDKTTKEKHGNENVSKNKYLLETLNKHMVKNPRNEKQNIINIDKRPSDTIKVKDKTLRNDKNNSNDDIVNGKISSEPINNREDKTTRKTLGSKKVREAISSSDALIKQTYELTRKEEHSQKDNRSSKILNKQENRTIYQENLRSEMSEIILEDERVKLNTLKNNKTRKNFKNDVLNSDSSINSQFFTKDIRAQEQKHEKTNVTGTRELMNKKNKHSPKKDNVFSSPNTDSLTLNPESNSVSDCCEIFQNNYLAQNSEDCEMSPIFQRQISKTSQSLNNKKDSGAPLKTDITSKIKLSSKLYSPQLAIKNVNSELASDSVPLNKNFKGETNQEKIIGDKVNSSSTQLAEKFFSSLNLSYSTLKVSSKITEELLSQNCASNEIIKQTNESIENVENGNKGFKSDNNLSQLSQNSYTPESNSKRIYDSSKEPNVASVGGLKNVLIKPIIIDKSRILRLPQITVSSNVNSVKNENLFRNNEINHDDSVRNLSDRSQNTIIKLPPDSIPFGKKSGISPKNLSNASYTPIKEQTINKKNYVIVRKNPKGIDSPIKYNLNEHQSKQATNVLRTDPPPSFIGLNESLTQSNNLSIPKIITSPSSNIGVISSKIKSPRKQIVVYPESTKHALVGGIVSKTELKFVNKNSGNSLNKNILNLSNADISNAVKAPLVDIDNNSPKSNIQISISEINKNYESIVASCKNSNTQKNPVINAIPSVKKQMKSPPNKLIGKTVQPLEYTANIIDKEQRTPEITTNKNKILKMANGKYKLPENMGDITINKVIKMNKLLPASSKPVMDGNKTYPKEEIIKNLESSQKTETLKFVDRTMTDDLMNKDKQKSNISDTVLSRHQNQEEVEKSVNNCLKILDKILTDDTMSTDKHKSTTSDTVISMKHKQGELDDTINLAVDNDFCIPDPEVSNYVNDFCETDPEVSNYIDIETSNSKCNSPVPVASKKIECPTCYMECSDEISLLNHLTEVHAHDQEINCTLYKCGTCGQGMNSKEALQLHIQSEHSDADGDKTFTCHRKLQYDSDESNIDIEHALQSNLETPIKNKQNEVSKDIGLHTSEINVKKLWCPVEEPTTVTPKVSKKKKKKKKKQCDICNKAFTNGLLLFNHNRIHHRDTKLFKCDSCSIWFSNLDSYKRHNCKVVSYFPCKKCNLRFPSKELMINHKRTLHNLGTLKCELCPKYFKCNKNLIKHVSMKHLHENLNVKVAKDKIIKSLKKSKSSIYDDLKIIKDADNNKVEISVRQKETSNTKNTICDHKCEVCDRKFKSESDLAKHSKIHKRGMYKCVKCLKKFPQKVHLLHHIRKVHKVTTDKLLRCNLCSAVFKFEDKLKQHYKLKHENREDNAKQHEITNADINTSADSSEVAKSEMFVCKDCGAYLPSMESLQRHMQWEHMKTHKCGHCGEVLATAEEFLRHLMSGHSNEKVKEVMPENSFKWKTQLAYKHERQAE